jgi:hypothetical protein
MEPIEDSIFKSLNKINDTINGLYYDIKTN